MESIIRELLEKEFDSTLIKKRKGRNNLILDYLETATVIRRLNEAFQSDWSFKILAHGVDTEARAVWVLGEITAMGLVKQQFGAKDIYEKSSLGDNLKSAASDCLKKCATLFGVGLHLYEDELPGESVEPVEEKTPEKNSSAVTQKQKELIMRLIGHFVKTSDEGKLEWLRAWLKEKNLPGSLDVKSASRVIELLQQEIKNSKEGNKS